MALMAELSFTIVAIDDDPRALELVRDVFSAEPDVSVVTASDASSGLDTVRRLRPRIVLLDLVIPGADGLSVLEDIIRFSPETDVILVTGNYSTDSAVEAIRKGASDYLTKPVGVSLLRERVGKLLEAERRRARANRLNAELMETCQFQGMVGSSPLMLEVFDRIRRAAPHFRTALVTGPTGTGKELVARALHSLSPVQSKALAVSNCSAIVETLFESELFGHVKGAFTGAVSDQVGFFEHAAGGTVFLDEIGDISLKTQTDLLRVLQEREITRVGGNQIIKVDFRCIAATNKDLEKLIEEGKFRPDLFYRLNVFRIELPPLRDRREDIPLLVDHFVRKLSLAMNKRITRVSPAAMNLLQQQPWLGNVRELENAVERAMVVGQEPELKEQDFIFKPQSVSNGSSKTLDDMERAHILRVVEECGGNQSHAAEVLDIDRVTLYHKLKKYGWTRASVDRDKKPDEVAR